MLAFPSALKTKTNPRASCEDLPRAFFLAQRWKSANEGRRHLGYGVNTTINDVANMSRDGGELGSWGGPGLSNPKSTKHHPTTQALSLGGLF